MHVRFQFNTYEIQYTIRYYKHVDPMYIHALWVKSKQEILYLLL